MACEHHVIGLKLEAGSELVYVTSILCDNDTVLVRVRLSPFFSLLTRSREAGRWRECPQFSGGGFFFSFYKQTQGRYGLLALTLDVAAGIFHVLIKPIPLRVWRKLGNVFLRGYLTGMASTWRRVFRACVLALVKPIPFGVSLSCLSVCLYPFVSDLRDLAESPWWVIAQSGASASQWGVGNTEQL